MTIYDLKPRFQDLLRPVCRSLAAAGVSANAVTMWALVLSLVVGLGPWLLDRPRWFLILVPITLFVRMALNAIDGMLAREHDMKTSLGAVLNELGDVLADLFLYLPFALLPEVPARLLVLIVVLGVVTEMAGVITVQIGASRRYDGPLGKSDRAFFFGLLALALFFDLPVEPALPWACAAVLLLQGWTIVNRSRRGLAELSS